ncbi:TPA: hypothetical protein ACJGTR_001919 [Salmonella enterica subsp. enterica serovar Hvittingfoss]
MNTENPFPRLKLASSVKQGQYSSNVSEKKVKKIKLFPSSHKPNTAGQYTFYAAIKSQSGQHKNKKSCSESIRIGSTLSRPVEYMMKSAKYTVRAIALYLSTFITTVFAFRVWSERHVMSAALLTTLCCSLALLAITME